MTARSDAADHNQQRNNRSDDAYLSVLTPEEEEAVLLEHHAALSSGPSRESASSTSSDQSSTWTTETSGSSESSSSSSSSSSNGNGGGAASPVPASSSGALPPLTLLLDPSEQTLEMFNAGNAWRLKEAGALPERVDIWSFEAETGAWARRVRHVAVSRLPFAVGAMRASFYCRDVTRQVAPEVEAEQDRQLRHASNDTAANRAAARARLAPCSFDRFATAATTTSGAPPSSSSCQTAAAAGVAVAVAAVASGPNSQPGELYVAKSYRRFAELRSPAQADKQEEVARHFRDAHMQGTAQFWAEAMNAQRPPCPRLCFVPSFVMVRGVAGASASASPTAGSPTNTASASTTNSSKPQHQGAPAPTATSGVASPPPLPPPPPASYITSKGCEFVSVEPILAGQFTKHNNNNGFVRTTTTTRPSSTTPGGRSRTAVATSLSTTSALELEARDAANALVHFTYKMSGRTLMVCDIQGVGGRFTDPQIHTIDGQGFGRGNLGPHGMYRCLRRHECSAVCRALALAPLDVEAERVFLKQEERRLRVGVRALVVRQVEMPPAIALRFSQQTDYSF